MYIIVVVVVKVAVAVKECNTTTVIMIPVVTIATHSVDSSVKKRVVVVKLGLITVVVVVDPQLLL